MEKLIILDTETTGLDIEKGHRIIEIGCVEVIDRIVTNKEYHQYIQPDKVVGESFDIHAISDKFLLNKPRFAEICDEFIEFITGHTLVIHNAPFDVGFIDHEFKLAGKKFKVHDICKVIDSMEVSKKLTAGGSHKLDVLCRRFNIDATARVVHGALLDAQILAKVYLALTGGQFDLFDNFHNAELDINNIKKITDRERATQVIYADSKELELHNNYFNQPKLTVD